MVQVPFAAMAEGHRVAAAAEPGMGTIVDQLGSDAVKTGDLELLERRACKQIVKQRLLQRRVRREAQRQRNEARRSRR